jgi:hypothetical protein
MPAGLAVGLALKKLRYGRSGPIRPGNTAFAPFQWVPRPGSQEGPEFGVFI